MESAMFAGLLLNPIAIVMAAAVVLLATVASYYVIPRARSMAFQKLVGGYVGALAVLIAICVATSYVSPEEAQTVWKVPPENYWGALWRQFLTMFVILCYATVLGIAVVGVPAIFLLNWKRRATVPWVLVVAACVSIVAGVALETFVPSRHPFQTLGYIIGGHLLLAVGFCVGARLPWSAPNASA